MQRIHTESIGDQSYQKSFNPEIVIYLLLGFWTLPPSIPPLSGQRDGFIAKERGIPGDQRQLGRSIDRGSLGSLFETRSQGSETSLSEQEAPGASGCRSSELFQQNLKPNFSVFLIDARNCEEKESLGEGKRSKRQRGEAPGRKKASPKTLAL